MARHRRRIAAVLVLAFASTALALLLANTSNNGSTAAAKAGTARLAHATLHEREQGDGGGADAEAYNDRAYPASDVTIDEIQGAINANAKLGKKLPKLASRWDSLGPETLNVDRLGTQSFIKPTQWSGRVTAMAITPTCTTLDCRLYVAAGGGGVWRASNPLAPNPAWKQISADIPTNVIGSIAIDPNDPTSNTIYAGTGEGNNSGDTEAGLGLYKSTDGGAHWALVPGSFAF